MADPCADGSAVFYNPAAIASQRGIASAGALAIFTQSTFTFDGGGSFESTQPAKPAPHLWVTGSVSHSIAAGIGVWAPYGLTTEWPLDFEGRFTGYNNTLRAIYIQPTIAARLMRGLAVGGGLNVVNTKVELQRRIDLARTNIPNTNLQFGALSIPDGTDFADAKLEADDWALTFHVGAQYQPSPRWSLGVRYMHAAELDLRGHANFDQVNTGIPLPAGNPLGVPAGTPIDVVLAPQFAAGGPLSDQSLTTAIELPSQFVAGVRYAATHVLRMFLEYQWTGWDKLDHAALRFATAPTDTLFLDFRNTSTMRFAAEFAPREELTVRGGVLYNDAATPDVVTPLLPEAKRVTLAGGAGYHINNRLRIDGALEVVLQGDREGSVRPREDREQTAAELNVGSYSSNAVIGGFTLSYVLGQHSAASALRTVRRLP